MNINDQNIGNRKYKFCFFLKKDEIERSGVVAAVIGYEIKMVKKKPKMLGLQCEHPVSRICETIYLQYHFCL